MAKKNETHQPAIPDPAKPVIAADTGNIETDKAETVAPAELLSEKPATVAEQAGTETIPENPAQTIGSDSSQINIQQPATAATPEQLLNGSTPAPPIIQPKRGPGRPKGSGKKEPQQQPGAVDPGASTVNIPGIIDGAAGPGVGIPAPEPVPTAPAVNHRQLAEVCFDLTTNSLAALLGPEWRADNDKEREAMVIPLEMYLRTKQVVDVPPGVILCFAIATYAAPRFRQEPTRSKISLAWAWVKAKWSARKGKKVLPTGKKQADEIINFPA